MKHSIKLALALTLLVGGCAEKEAEKAQDAPQAAPAAEKAPVEEAPAAELSPEEPSSETDGLAVPEDFEEEAARTVKLENVDAELDRLQVEIDG